MSNAVEAENLSYAYNKTKVLHKLCFNIPKACFTILIGPNGSGKTTLMKILAGILKPKGKLNIFNRSFAQLGRKELAQLIAFVPQHLPADFPFTVKEIVLMGRTPHLGILGIDKKTDADIAEKVMEYTNISSLGNRRLNKLSGGELQRVFIARALCQESEIILLDEPTAFLDMAHQIQVMDLLEKLKNEQKLTIIMVSHDINLAAMYGDQLLLMKQGTLVDAGEPEKVLDVKTLEQVYGCVLLIDKNPLGNFPAVTAVPGRYITVGCVRQQP